MSKLINYSLLEINKIATDLFNNYMSNNRIICFIGEMGCGKTTLIKAILSQLKYLKNVTSPTFSIVHQYPIEHHIYNNVIHFDLFRIENEDELWEIGFEEYIDNPKNLILIEWPQIGYNFISHPKVLLYFTKIDTSEREISIIVEN